MVGHVGLVNCSKNVVCLEYNNIASFIPGAGCLIILVLCLEPRTHVRHCHSPLMEQLLLNDFSNRRSIPTQIRLTSSLDLLELYPG